MLQPLLRNGKTGAIGLNAQPLVARGSNLGPVLAVNQSLGAMNSVLEMLQWLKAVAQLNAQVNLICDDLIYLGKPSQVPRPSCEPSE